MIANVLIAHARRRSERGKEGWQLVAGRALGLLPVPGRLHRLPRLRARLAPAPKAAADAEAAKAAKAKAKAAKAAKAAAARPRRAVLRKLLVRFRGKGSAWCCCGGGGGEAKARSR